MGVADELDPAIVDFDDETAPVELDVDVAASAQHQREGGDHGAVEDERLGRLHLLVEHHVRRVVITARMQHGRRVNPHLSTNPINQSNQLTN